MCFLRPIVQFELTCALDCTCLASSVASLASHGRVRCRSWACGDHLQSRLLLPLILVGTDALSAACYSAWVGALSSRGSVSLVYRGMELHLSPFFTKFVTNFFLFFLYYFFFSSDQLYLEIYFEKSNKLFVLNAYVSNENEFDGYISTQHKMHVF